MKILKKNLRHAKQVLSPRPGEASSNRKNIMHLTGRVSETLHLLEVCKGDSIEQESNIIHTKTQEKERVLFRAAKGASIASPGWNRDRNDHTDHQLGMGRKGERSLI